MLGVLTQTIDNETHNIINLRNGIINTPLKCISKLGHFDTFCSPKNLVGASPESRRKVAGKLLKLNFFWKLEVEEKYDVMVVSGMDFEACKALYL
jgi:hypothetical protein